MSKLLFFLSSSLFSLNTLQHSVSVSSLSSKLIRKRIVSTLQFNAISSASLTSLASTPVCVIPIVSRMQNLNGTPLCFSCAISISSPLGRLATEIWSISRLYGAFGSNNTDSIFLPSSPPSREYCIMFSEKSSSPIESHRRPSMTSPILSSHLI